MDKVDVWKDRANPLYVQLSKLGTLLTVDEMEAITKVELRFNGVYYGSDSYSEIFDLVTYKSDSKIMFKPGLLPLAVMSDIAEFIVYDAANTDGIMWLQMRMTVKEDAEKISAT